MHWICPESSYPSTLQWIEGVYETTSRERNGGYTKPR
jgi:hypothetical protein